jgi:hypothetical protein
MRDGEPVQTFTAIGEIAEGEPESFDMGSGFVPYRRAVRFYTSSDAPIRPLLPLLSFTRGRPNWGMELASARINDPVEHASVWICYGITVDIATGLAPARALYLGQRARDRHGARPEMASTARDPVGAAFLSLSCTLIRWGAIGLIWYERDRIAIDRLLVPTE